MIQPDRPQSNLGAIEALKAATRQVDRQSTPSYKNPGSPVVMSPATPVARGGSQQRPRSMPASETFSEAFMRKMTSVIQEEAKIEKEQLAVDQELDRVLKLQSDLTEKRKKLEQRKNELIKVKDKFAALDKEISEALKFPLL